MSADLKAAIRRIPDFPKKGIVFRDITTLWKDGKLLRKTTAILCSRYKRKGIDKVLGIESRGFVVAAPLADRLGVGFVPLRKLGKLPAPRISEKYQLEYGTAELEIHKDAIERGEKVLIVDDLIATGGTALAAARLVEALGGKVEGFAFVVELSFLKGRSFLKGYPVYSIVRYESEDE